MRGIVSTVFGQDTECVLEWRIGFSLSWLFIWNGDRSKDGPSKPPLVFVCGCYGFESRGRVNQTRYSATKVFKTGFVFSWLDPMYLYSRKFILRKEYNVEKLLSVHCFLLLELLIKMHTICYRGNNNNLALSVLVFYRDEWFLKRRQF